MTKSSGNSPPAPPSFHPLSPAPKSVPLPPPIPRHCLHEFQKDNQAAETEDQSHGDANYNCGRLSKRKIARHDILLFFGLLEGQRGPLSIDREGAAFAVSIKGYS